MTQRMTARQRVRMAFAHCSPDRVPFSWGFGPTPEMTQCLREQLAIRGIDFDRLRTVSDDVIRLSPRYTGPELPPHSDIWGIGYKPASYGGGVYQEFDRLPLAGATRIEQIDAYPWPDPGTYAYETYRAGIEEALAAQGDKAVLAPGGNPFEIYCWMTGLEEAFINLVTRPDIVRRALERITLFFLKRLERICRAAGDRIDLWFFADDLGGQQGLLMSPAMYRKILQPFHRQLFVAAKQLAPDAVVMMHSDGSVFDLLPDLIEAGMEVLEAVQVDCARMEPERLKSTYGKHLGFYGGISVQHLLTHAGPEAVETGCRHLVEVFGRGRGYMAAPSHAIQYGTPVENVFAMLRAVLGEDYPRMLEAARIELS